MPNSHYEQALSNWAFHFKARFPTWLDSRFTKGLYSLLGDAHPSFLSKSPLSHLKRLLLVQFFLQKKIEAKLKQDHTAHLCVNTFSIDSRLCISIAASNTEHTLTCHAILQVASQKVPALMEVSHSCYQWMSPTLPYTFLYIELDKMRGQDLSPIEVKEVETYLSSHLLPFINKPSIFWPYNHEDAFKHILTLGKEVTKEDDYPQVMIHFQKQTADSLEFLILLARPEQAITKETTLTPDSFPPSARFIFRLKHTLATTFPVLGEAFSLELPSERFKVGTTTNLLHAREFVAKLLYDVLGTFRDYNGGLFEVQKKHYQQLEETFSQKIPTFSLFGKELFYSLTPAEAPLCLDTPLWRELFKAFSHTLSKKAPFSTKKTKHILILKSKDLERLTSYLEKAKRLQEEGKITAYAHLKVGLEHYLVFIDEMGNDIATIKTTQDQSQKNRVLRLAFQTGEIPSLYPYYLSKEIRGKTIAKLLFEGLFQLNTNYQVQPAGCESFTLSKNKKRYLFKLRENYWSNGEQVTAFDYEKAWKKLFLEKDIPRPFYVLKYAEAVRKKEKPLDLLGVKAIDKYQLQVDLEKENPYFLKLLTHPLFFPSLESYSENSYFNGPYCKKKKTNQNLLLERNPYYWNKKSLFYQEITVLAELSANRISKLFTKGKVDWVGTPFTYDSKISKPIIIKNQPYPFFIYFNTKHFFLSSPFIRQAFSCAIDRSLITKYIFPESHPLFTLFPKDLSSSKLELTDKNMEKSKELFDKGLHELSLTRKTFPSLTLSSCSLSAHKTLAEYLKKSWEDAFDIHIDLDIETWNPFYHKIEQGNFHIAGFFKNLFSFDSISFLESFAYKETNFSYWECAEYTKLIFLIKKASSKKAKAVLFREIEDTLLNHVPVIPLCYLLYSYTHSPGLRNYIIDQDGSVDFRFAFTQNKPSEGREFPYDQSKPPLSLSDMHDIALD